MELRQEQQWSSFSMAPSKWVRAAHDYNERLEAKNNANGLPTIRKCPRALVLKLGEIEPKILDRLARQDFTCEFHCSSTCSLID
jgi:hypothetical protein